MKSEVLHLQDTMDRKSAGIIAQELEKVLPEAVREKTCTT